MIIAWVAFTFSTFLFLVWSTEIIPRFKSNRDRRTIRINLWVNLIIATLSAQYIWG